MNPGSQNPVQFVQSTAHLCYEGYEGLKGFSNSFIREIKINIYKKYLKTAKTRHTRNCQFVTPVSQNLVPICPIDGKELFHR